MNLFTFVSGRGRGDDRRHLIPTGPGTSFPVALCEAPIRLSDDPLAMPCTPCTVKALSAIALTLEAIGSAELAVLATRRASDLSFETRKGEVDADWAPGELSEAFGR